MTSVIDVRLTTLLAASGATSISRWMSAPSLGTTDVAPTQVSARPYVRWTEAERQRLAELVQAKHTIPEIAQLLGRSISSIDNAAWKLTGAKNPQVRRTPVLAPPFPYFGSKQNVAAQIVGLLPAHKHYIEPFAGSLAVLLNKPRAVKETVNDSDSALMVFWRVLRDHPDALTRLVEDTPHSRQEYEAALDLTVADELEKARRVWVLLTQGWTGLLMNSGWRYQVAAPSVPIPRILACWTARLPLVADRLRGVSLECRNASEVIQVYGRDPDVLLNCDPPYPAEVRSRSQGRYREEMVEDHSHRELSDLLKQCKSAVVLSGYASHLYDNLLYPDWHRIELSARGYSNSKRIEVLWSNRPFAQGV